MAGFTSSSSTLRSAIKNWAGGFNFGLVEKFVSSVLFREYYPSRDWRPLKLTTGVSAAVGLKIGREGLGFSYASSIMSAVRNTF